jgi:hypothetical protein
MHATTATCRDGGRGSGPVKDFAYSALLRRYSSVTDTGMASRSKVLERRG